MASMSAAAVRRFADDKNLPANLAQAERTPVLGDDTRASAAGPRPTHQPRSPTKLCRIAGHHLPDVDQRRAT
jgi:hypothetical protein